MNLVIKSFILSLLAVSNGNAASIRGTRQAPSWWSTHDAVEACTSTGTSRKCGRCATDQLRLCLNNSDEDTAVCDRFFENTINRCQRLTFDNEAEAEASFVAIGSSSDGCLVNRDCPSNHICQFRGREARGTCVRRNASSSSDDIQTCRRNNDCPDPDTQRCNDAGFCVIRNRMVPRSGDTCIDNGDCGANRICGDMKGAYSRVTYTSINYVT